MNGGELPNFHEDLSKLPDVVRSLAATDCYDDIDANCKWLFNYYNRPVSSFSGGIDYVDDASLHVNGYNLTRKAVDTAVAILGRPVHVQVAPIGGDFEVSRNAELMTRISDGIDDACGFEQKARRVLRTACICHVGAIRGYIEKGELKADWVNPQYLTWNADEEELTEIFYSPPVPRRKLIALFPGKKEAINKAQNYDPMPIPGVEPTSRGFRDCVQVHEVVSLTVGNRKGMRALVLDNGAVLSREPWEINVLPFALLRWSPSWRGPGGVSLAAQVASFHRRLNVTAKTIMESSRGCIPRVLRNIDEPSSQIGDFPWEEVLYDKIKPDMSAANTISQQLLDLKKEIESDCFSYVGLSEMIAANTRPAGLNSEPAQLAWMDIANIRMYERQKEWEGFNVQWMKIKMALASRAYQSKSVRVMAPGTKLIEEVKWPSDYREEQYSYRAIAGSGLPLTLSGRMQTLTELKALAPGAFSDGDLVKAIGIPDVESARDMINAPMDMAQKMIDDAIQEGKVTVPSQLQGVDGLDMLIKHGSRKYQRSLTSGNAPPENLEILRRMILHAQELIGIMNKQATPPPPPPAPVISAPITTAPVAQAPTPYLTQGGSQV